jgi:hypothetical protein
MKAILNQAGHIIEKIGDALVSMTPRDRMLLIGLVVAFGLTAIGATVYTLSSSLDTIRSDISNANENIAKIEQMKGEQASLKLKVEEIEAKLQANAKTDLSAFLEQSAQKSGIREKLEAVREKSSAKDGLLQEKTFAVSLRDLSLEELTKFLYAIETSGYPMQVQTCSVRSRKRQEEKTLTVNMDISAFKLLEEGLQ